MNKEKNQTVHMPPQAVEAEMAVLGAIMLDSQAASTAFEILDETAFYRDIHRKIFLASLSLYERNEPIDVLMVATELKKKNDLEAIGGDYYLTELVDRLPSAANAEYYCRIVHGKSLLRKLITISNEIQEESYRSSQEPHEIIDGAEKKIFELSETRHRRDFSHIKPILHKTMDAYEAYHGLMDGITGVPTGFKLLDNQLSGMQKSELLILAARPSMGKTALALNIATNAAKKGHKVAIFSLEMASVQLTMRLLCSETHVDAHAARTGRMKEGDWMRLSTMAGEIAKLDIFIDDSPGMNILEIRSKARRLKIEHKIDLLIIDYLQLIRGVGRIESRQIEIAMISQSLKGLAKELEIPVLSLSQLSRAVESRSGDRRPMLSDLRESGAIEQDADVVMFIYRPAAYGPVEPEQENLAEVIVAKQRNGPVGTVQLAFVREFVLFTDMEKYAKEVEMVSPDPF